MGRSAMHKWGLGTAMAAGMGAAAAAWLAPAPAAACGGLFCSATNPVNQAAEQIIFSDNGDGTVTAVIQILYEGPPTKFAWVLPIPGNPTVGVSSTQALDTIKNASNPIYRLNTVLGDGCDQVGFGNAGGPIGAPTAGAAEDGADRGVSVLASGAIGPYLYDTIAIDTSLPDPADVAIDWLTTNGYDVGDLGPDVLRPYLEDGLNLIAFKLSSGSDTGSIRPVMITYEATRPSIPIRPTAVAANDDMGVLVFLLSADRGIPENYKALELNEALIDWFNPNNNYNEVVTRAADEASGQGFVTEYAGKIDGTSRGGVFIEVFADWQRDQWTQFQSRTFADPREMVQAANESWSGYDGLDDAFGAAVTLPDGISLEDFENCMACYMSQPGVVFDTTVYLQKLYEWVVKPMIETQKLLDARPYMTRLYTTMSAREMTMDPVFAFNPDLEDVSNQHVADRVIECKNGLDPFATGTPWSVMLPQGDVVVGDDPSVWPVDIESQPAALKILQFATQGQGDVIEDRSEMIANALAGAGGSMPSGSTGGEPTKPTDPVGGGSGTTMEPTGSGTDAPKGVPGEPGAAMTSAGDSGCRVGARTGVQDAWALALGALALLRRRRRG